MKYVSDNKQQNVLGLVVNGGQVRIDNAQPTNPTKELIDDIYNFIDKIKDDREKIESIYKVIKSLSNE